MKIKEVVTVVSFYLVGWKQKGSKRYYFKKQVVPFSHSSPSILFYEDNKGERVNQGGDFNEVLSLLYVSTNVSSHMHLHKTT